MAIVTTDNQNYSDIADAIRSKLSTSETFKPAQMASAIMSIQTGGGIIPSGTISISSNGTYDVTSFATASVDVHAEHEDYIKKYTSANALTTFTDTSATTIVYGAFAYTSSLATVSFPEATTIGTYAFAYCYKLANISFPKVKTINTYAFQYCSSLVMPINSTTFPALSGTLNGYAFRGCQRLTGVDLSNVTSLGAQTFSACSRIKTVNLPNVTSIGAGAFSYLTTCSEYSLPKLTYVASNAFTSNWSLTNITLPKVTTISVYAFRYCSNLMSIYLTGSTIPTLNKSAFNNMPVAVSTGGVYASIYVPSSLYATYQTATNWATYKNRIVSIT